MTTRFSDTFAELEAKHEGAFVPFVTLCDPDFDTSFEILKTLVDNGADALELGVPFSDPCADGVVIQLANRRSLDSGARVDDMLRLIGKVREYAPKLPISILIYANPVLARGIDKFFADAAACGLDAVLIPDVPANMIHTCADFYECAKRHDVNTVLIAPPNASDAQLEEIAKICTGYTYMLSRYGITGTDNASGHPREIMRKLKALGAPKCILGFGVSKPEHVKAALEDGAAGAIAGSAVVKLVAANLDNKEKMLSEIASYVRTMKAATLP